MKISVLYYSASGKTKEMAEVIAKGARKIDGVEVKLFSIEDIDYDFVNDSSAVLFGTPTYYANMCWQFKKWIDTEKNLNLAGKIGSCFATANFIQGGGDLALLGLINHLLVKGMLMYSAGCSEGQPYTHLGPVATKDSFEEAKAMFEIYGERVAKKAMEIFG